MMETSKNFLRVLVEPEAPATPDIDIVAVHGLNPFKNTSNAVSTWTSSDGKLWLRDPEFLPTQIPNARILLFGYNSNVAFTSSNAGLVEQAANLLFLLDSRRTGCSNRPIIFLCHSLGGILVKRALVHARLVDAYASIYQATYGIVFFAVPHGGGNNAKVGSLAARIARKLSSREGNSFMEALKKNSYYGEQNRDDFLHLAKDFMFVSFYEANPTRRLKIFTTQVVDRQNAILGLVDEREPKFAMDADHSQICKFSDPKGDDYYPVWTNILRMAQGAIAHSRASEISDILVKTQQLDLENTKDAEETKTYYILPTLAVNTFIKRPSLMNNLEATLTLVHESACAVAVLLGMGGQGKSQLSMEYCRLSRSKGLFQAIFWIDATSDNSLIRSFDKIIERISPGPPAFTNLASKIEFCKDIIEQWSFPWLLVFDNYDRPDQVMNISTCFPQSASGKIIVTSRHAGSRRLGKVIHVTGMSEEECLNLLFSRCELIRSTETEPEAKSIVSQLGYLPLAIDQAAAYMCAQSLSMPAFATHYRNRKAYILTYTPSLFEYRKKLNNSDAEIALNVFTTLELSLQAIPGSDTTRKQIEDFLSLLAFFNIKSIGEDIAKVAAGSGDIDCGKMMEPFLSEDGWDHYKYRDIISSLNQLSLLHIVDDLDEIYFTLHPLVADWLKLRREKSFCRTAMIKTGSVLTSLIEAQDWGGMYFATSQYLLGHLESCVQNQILYLEEADYEESTVLKQLHYFAYFLRKIDHNIEAEDLYRRVLQMDEKAFGAEHRVTMNTVHNFGRVYIQIGKMKEAEKMFQRALQGFTKIHGADHSHTLGAVHSLAFLYQRQGKLEDAEEMYQRAAQGYEKIHGADHKYTQCAVIFLGRLYQEQGKQKEAEEIYLRLLQDCGKICDGDHGSTLNLYHHLGLLYQNQGRLEEAEEMYKRALQGREKIYGVDYRSTLKTVQQMASLYTEQGKLKEAREMYQWALQGHTKVNGEDHKSSADNMYSLGKVFEKQRRLEEAEDMFQRALQGYIKVNGEGHQSLTGTMCNLGRVFWKQGRLEEAKDMLQLMLQECTKVSREDHESARAMYYLAKVLWKQERLEEARDMFRRAAQGFEKSLGAENSSTVEALKAIDLVQSMIDSKA